MPTQAQPVTADPTVRKRYPVSPPVILCGPGISSAQPLCVAAMSGTPGAVRLPSTDPYPPASRRLITCAIVALTVHVAGCASEAERVYDEQASIDDKECKKPATLKELKRPLEQQYEDQGVKLDYDRLAPYERTRLDGDSDYSELVFFHPQLLEQVYYDAAEGHEQARFMACFYDMSARRIGRAMVQHLMSLRCVSALNCTVKTDKLPISLHTESGIRLYEQIWDEFEKESRRRSAKWDLFNNTLALYVGLKIAAPATTGGTRALGAGSGRQLTTGNTGTVGQTTSPGSRSAQSTSTTSSAPAVVVGTKPVTSSAPASTTRSATSTAPVPSSVAAPTGTTSAAAPSATTTTPAPSTTATTATPSTTAMTRGPTASTAPIRSVATATPARGGAGPVRRGQAGEAAVRARYEIGPKVKIKVNGRNRIPDGETNTVLSEVKNVKKLSYTRQLRDFADYCAETGKEFHLYARYDATATQPLLDAIKRGVIELRYIP